MVDLSLAGIVVSSLTSDFDPRKTLSRSEGLEILVLLISDLLEMPVTEFLPALSEGLDDDDLPGMVEAVRALALDPKRLLLWEDEGVKSLPPVICAPSKTLPEAAWLVLFSENTTGGGDLAETDVDVWTLELNPDI